MAGASSRGVWKQLDELFCFGASGQLGDDELLGRFLAGHRDDAAEAAFAALVERHGPMVLGVCRRVLGDRHEAEDAFQATFLVLARKAGAIARREQLANWLHGVASRTALDARARADRRRAREHRAFAMSAAESSPDDATERGELRAAVDEELARLPASYRGAVVLCELDGLSRHAAARRLGIPEGTLSSRLARAKGLLRHRLTRRGLAPSVMALDVALSREARALILPPALAGSTIRAATRVAAGASLAEAVSASVVTLTRGALHTMLLAKIKGIALGLATAAVVTTSVGVLAQSGARGALPLLPTSASAPWRRSSTGSWRPWGPTASAAGARARGCVGRVAPRHRPMSRRRGGRGGGGSRFARCCSRRGVARCAPAGDDGLDGAYDEGPDGGPDGGDGGDDEGQDGEPDRSPRRRPRAPVRRPRAPTRRDGEPVHVRGPERSAYAAPGTGRSRRRPFFGARRWIRGGGPPPLELLRGRHSSRTSGSLFGRSLHARHGPSLRAQHDSFLRRVGGPLRSIGLGRSIR